MRAAFSHVAGPTPAKRAPSRRAHGRVAVQASSQQCVPFLASHLDARGLGRRRQQLQQLQLPRLP
jgi:hypothetical protein